jgi:hypothetical protein
MKTFHLYRLAALAGSLLFISGAHAQPNAVDVPPASSGQNDYGLLGKPYFAFEANLVQYRGSQSNPTGFGSELALNVATGDYVDVGLTYDFSHAKNAAWRTTDNIGRIYTTGFIKFNHVTPYATVGFGYSWEKASQAVGTPQQGSRFHSALYDLGTGVEIPLVAQTSVRLGIGYEESFRKPRPTDLSYQLALDYQFDDMFCTDVGASLQDGRYGAHDAVVYHAGIRIVFD